MAEGDERRQGKTIEGMREEREGREGEGNGSKEGKGKERRWEERGEKRRKE